MKVDEYRELHPDCEYCNHNIPPFEKCSATNKRISKRTAKNVLVMCLKNGNMEQTRKAVSDMEERKIKKRYKWAGDILPKLLEMGIDADQASAFLDSIEDAVVEEVVRCNDCKYKVLTSDGDYNPEDIVCEYHMSDGFNKNDFCSYGERKE